MKKVFYILCVAFGLLAELSSCRKILEIPQPVNEETTQEVFSNDELATNALLGIYSNMINNTTGGVGFGNGFFSVFVGASSDELMFFDQTNVSNVQFQDNTLQSTNGSVYTQMWSQPYNLLYSANAAIAGLAASTTVHDSVKNELTGEAEFLRAFIYFYLVNSFGNVPLVTTTNFEKTSTLARAPSASIYDLIVSDLKDAQQRLPGDYSVGQGERIIPNKYAAAALLARVYLYQQDWPNAVSEADSVLNNTNLYSLVPLNQVFLMNSMEAIWQLQINANTGSTYNVTPEGYLVIPYDNTSQPFVYLAPSLLSAFEPNDQRDSLWVDSTVYSGTTYYYPYKYEYGPAQQASGGNINEYYMMLRLGEQFLIRAEAEANGGGGGLGSAIMDLNTIRTRANLPSYAGPGNNQDSVLTAIYHERQVELFAEWGQRWFDLRRNGQSNNVLGQITYKEPWSINALLFPIPYQELTVDPNLVQNLGY